MKEGSPGTEGIVNDSLTDEGNRQQNGCRPPSPADPGQNNIEMEALPDPARTDARRTAPAPPVALVEKNNSEPYVQQRSDP
jgi:hypothetical protein